MFKIPWKGHVSNEEVLRYIFGTYNEERGHGECVTHKARKEASSKLRNRFWLMYGRTGIWNDFIGIYFT